MRRSSEASESLETDCAKGAGAVYARAVTGNRHFPVGTSLGGLDRCRGSSYCTDSVPPIGEKWKRDGTRKRPFDEESLPCLGRETVS